jgi:septum formation protein
VPTPLSEARPLLLGSASPRRRELVGSLGIPCVILAADVDERTESGERPEPYLERVVTAKRLAVHARAGDRPFAALLVADTSVTLGDEILGKPADVEEAERMLERLAGREHRVLTRYSLSLPDGALVSERTVSSSVWIRSATRDELRRYAHSGEGLDKAGAYAVQGLGAFLVERIDGSYTNVVGLPSCELVVDLRDAGLLGPFP